MLYESREAFIELFNDYPSIESEAKYKTNHGKRIPSMSECIWRNRVVKLSNYSNLKIIKPRKKLQRFPIALAQVKPGNTSENLLNEIRLIIYSSYRAKEFTKEVYSNIMNLIKLLNRIDTIFMNSQNMKTSNPHRLLFNLSDKIYLKKREICFSIKS